MLWQFGEHEMTKFSTSNKKIILNYTSILEKKGDSLAYSIHLTAPSTELQLVDNASSWMLQAGD
jgi:hypothetical protein